MLQLFERGNLQPLNGEAVLQRLREKRGAGLVDRLIAEDYRQRGATALTNDKGMAKLDGAERL